MRLWHVDLLPVLPRQQLLGQHREACALRGQGWGKTHSVVNYVFEHSYAWLYWYHCGVMDEMRRRGYKVEPKWGDCHYRGKAIGFEYSPFIDAKGTLQNYPEHNDAYLAECIKNLAGKGINISMAEVEDARQQNEKGKI